MAYAIGSCAARRDEQPSFAFWSPGQSSWSDWSCSGGILRQLAELLDYVPYGGKLRKCLKV